MNILREYGISFEDWGETFKLDKDKRFELAHYAESLLKIRDSRLCFPKWNLMCFRKFGGCPSPTTSC